METNNPESGRLDQSVVLLTWNSTISPLPRAACVTSGVPSASRAHVCSVSVAEGRARTCRETVTSLGGTKPANGEVASNWASFCGVPHVMEPPSWRAPSSKVTGSRSCVGGWVFSLSVVSAASSCWAPARVGPAKRISVPPFFTHSRTFSRVSGSASVPSGAIKTESGRLKRAVGVPSCNSAEGARARRR